jgi:hypothetical protein
MNDIQAVDKVEALILESVNAWTNYEKRIAVKEHCRCNQRVQERTGHE